MGPEFPAELYRFGAEKPRGYSLLKRECPPGPLKRNAGGDFDFPPHPLETTQRGGLRPFPLETLLGRRRRASPLETPLGDGERQRKEGQRASYLQPRCVADFLVWGCSSGWSRYSATGRRLPDLVGSAWRPAPVLGELTVSSVNSSLTFFLFHRARRIFFLMSQKENGGCIPTVKPCILVPQSGTMLHPLRRFAAPLCGAKKM